MVSSNEFKIRITGKGGHAAMPHNGIDPVPVETPEGRAAFAVAQRVIAERGQQLRRRITAALRAIPSPPEAAPAPRGAPDDIPQGV